MNRHMILAIALIALLLSGCTLTGVRGSGNVVTETRQVSDFDRVTLSGSGHVVITQGAEEGLSVEADDNLMQYVRTGVSGRTLELGLDAPGTIVTPSQPIRYNVSVKDLVGLEVSGSGDIESASIETDRLELRVSGSGDIRTDSLTAKALDGDISGSGEVVLAGEVPEQRIKIDGSGTFDAGDLRGERVVLTINGSGDATVWATESLEGRLSGSGSASYYGSPTTDVSASGSGEFQGLGEKGEIEPEVEEAAAPALVEAEEEEAATPDYSLITGELSQLIQGAVEEAGITGLSVALVDDQEIVWSEGFGYADKENGVEATPETVYGVASISKLFTAAAIMQLAEQDEIDIDQPLQTYVLEFSINSRFPGAGPITPRSLLTHHSGLPSDWTNGMFAFGDDRDALTRREYQDLVQEIEGAHVTNPPNTAFSYSNLGYSLLGHTVEQVTGQEFSDYMDEAILKPMGMDSSSFTLRSDMKPLLSKEYLSGEEQEVIWGRDIPAASLRSTVEDLSRFVMMVFGDGELGGQRILRAETLAEMLRPQNSDVPLDFDARWGLSWWLIPLLDYAGENAWHTGGEGMWNSILFILPDHKLGVVVLSNSGEAGMVNFQIATAVLEQALAAKAGIERPPAEAPDVVSLSPDELLSYEGLYTTDLGWMNIRADGTDLYADAMGQSFKLLPHGEGRFSIEGVSASDAQVAIKEVNGRTALNLYGFAVGGLGYGERLEPSTVPEAWMDRLGSYEITNGKPDFLTFLTDVQLKYENDFLMLDVTRSDTGDQLAFPIGPLSDDEAVILGLGQRNRGETISVVEVDGEEQLFYSGYLMKKLGTTELLQGILEAAVESPETHYPGVVLHVSSPELGTWTGAAGLGNTETDTAMRPHDRFRAGSLTKPFISVVILQLVEEGRFSLDDPMTAVLPESITDKFADSDQITVRMLLNHTGGLPDFMDLAGPEIFANLEKVWEEEEFLDFAATQEPLFAPGEAQAYSNTDYTLLGMVIEEATGRTWREEMRERIIEPLNLENTLLPEPDDVTIPGDHARGYADFGEGLFDATEMATASVVGAAGGQSMVTNAEDLSRFVTAVAAGELFQEAGTMEEMLTFVDWPDGNPLSPYVAGYGLGLIQAPFGSGIEGVGHSGNTAGGYSSFVFYLPAQGMTISGAVNIEDIFAGFLLIPRALEVLVPGYSAPEPEEEQPMSAGNVYEDPEGRFSIALVGDWTPVETDGTYVQVAYADAPLTLSLVTVETDDLEAGVDAALTQAGIDPAALTEAARGSWDRWSAIFYTMGDGQGVSVLGQTSDNTSYYFVATGPGDLAQNPPEDVLETIQGFSLSGEVSLPATVEAFENYVNSFVGTEPPGLSMAIALGEDVLYEQGFGMADGPRELPATPDTVYQWASVTKTMTAAAIMQLREQGLIDLDAPVSDYLDYFPAQYPITVRHLLTHSSGLPEPADFLLVHLRLKGQPSPDFDAVDREYYEGLPNLMFEPGSQSAYVNPDYVTLGQVIAAVSGQPYEEYVREHILNPLGMTNTDFTYSNDFMEANAAASAVPAAEAKAIVALMDEARGLGDGADFFQETGENNAWLYPYIVGDGAGGALLGPVTEMIRFGQMMLNEGELDGVRLLEPESVALLQEVQTSTSGEPLGIGLAWHFGGDAEHPYIEHDGGGTFQTKLRLYMKDGFAVAIMANGAGFDRNELADAAANVVFSTMGQ